MTRVFIFILVMLAACSDEKPSLAGEDPVKVEDFIAFFPEAMLPLVVSDSIMNKKDNDSLLISYKVFTQFVPDTSMRGVIGKTAKPRIFPLGRVVVSDEEIYLLAKILHSGKKETLLLSFDDDNTYAGMLSFLKLDADRTTKQVSTIDRQYSIHKSVSRANSNGTLSEGKEVYVYNKDAAEFMLIMTEALDENATELINPLDTLPRTNKYSADYQKDKRNIVSVRDSKKPGRFQFFVHIETAKAACTGELKGEAVFVSASKAEYRQPGDPCALEFSFTNSGVTLKEIEGCGARRDLKCSFNGTYPKKREPKSKTAKKTSK